MERDIGVRGEGSILDPFLSHGTTLCRLPQILLSHYWAKLDWHPSLKVRPLIPNLPLPVTPNTFMSG